MPGLEFLSGDQSHRHDRLRTDVRGDFERPSLIAAVKNLKTCTISRAKRQASAVNCMLCRHTMPGITLVFATPAQIFAKSRKPFGGCSSGSHHFRTAGSRKPAFGNPPDPISHLVCLVTQQPQSPANDAVMCPGAMKSPAFSPGEYPKPLPSGFTLKFVHLNCTDLAIRV